MPTLIDTHAWVWWVTEDPRLSTEAGRAISQAQATGSLLLSAISVWEIAKKIEKTQLGLDRPIEQWTDLALAGPGLQLMDVTRQILVESCRLPQPFHGDPADQIIVATARLCDAVLITKDEKIRRYPHVRSLW